MKTKLNIGIVIGTFLIGTLLGSLIYSKSIGSATGTSFSGSGGGGFFGSDPIYSVRADLNSATTTPCALLGPSASSTVMSFIMNITNGTSTQGVLVIGTSTTPYATSTSMIASYTIPANSQATIDWTPHTTASTSANIWSPNTYIVAGMTNGSGVNYGYTYVGSCKALANLSN